MTKVYEDWSMIIICTAQALSGATADADRECDVWYEKDYVVSGRYAVMIYPKLHWKPVGKIILDEEDDLS